MSKKVNKIRHGWACPGYSRLVQADASCKIINLEIALEFSYRNLRADADIWLLFTNVRSWSASALSSAQLVRTGLDERNGIFNGKE